MQISLRLSFKSPPACPWICLSFLCLLSAHMNTGVDTISSPCIWHPLHGSLYLSKLTPKIWPHTYWLLCDEIQWAHLLLTVRAHILGWLVYSGHCSKWSSLSLALTMTLWSKCLRKPLWQAENWTKPLLREVNSNTITCGDCYHQIEHSRQLYIIKQVNFLTIFY